MSFSENPTRREPLTAEDGRLIEAITCRQCGYRLEGLMPQMNCPECGTPLAASLQSNFLRFCDPAWVKAISLGVLINIIMVIVSVLFRIGLAIAAMVVVIQSISQNSKPFDPRVLQAMFQNQFVMLPITAIIGLVTLYGYWLITRPEPGAAQDHRILRGVIRTGFIAAFFTNLIVVFFSAQSLGYTYNTVLQSTQGLIGMIGFGSLLWYLSILTNRLPNRSLGTQLRIILVGFLVILLMLFLTSGFSIYAVHQGLMIMETSGSPTVSSTSPLRYIMIIYSLLAGATGLISLVFGVWVFVLAIIIWRAFRQTYIDNEALLKSVNAG